MRKGELRKAIRARTLSIPPKAAGSAQETGPGGMAQHGNEYHNPDMTVANTAITGATKTKITYDTKGLVTVGADATAADVGAEASGAVATHAALGTGVHGVGASSIESIAGSAGKVSTHAEITSSVHGFDSSGNAPPQIHGSGGHTGNIGSESQITFNTSGGHAHTGADSKAVDHDNLANKGTNIHSAIDTFINSKASASGLASLDASSLVVQAIQRLLSGTGSVTATEGYLRWQSTKKQLGLYDTQRERMITDRGWMPYAYPINFVASLAFTTSLALAAAGGCVAIPIWLDGHMLLQSVSVRSNDTATARTWGWDLYEQYLNNGNAGENSLVRILQSNGNETFTPTVASTRTLDVTSAPQYIGPGCYWLVVQSRHATSNFGLGTTAASTAFALNTMQTKTITNPSPDPLDFVAATWTKSTAVAAVRLNGRVFGQTAAF